MNSEISRERFQPAEDGSYNLGSPEQVREDIQAQIEELERAIASEPNHEKLVDLTEQLRLLKSGKKLIQ